MTERRHVMRTWFTILTLALAPVATVQGQTLGLFADSLGTDCNIEVPFPGGPVAAYVVGTLENNEDHGAVGAAFRIELQPL